MLKYKDKNILVLGLALTGVSTVRTLEKLGANIAISDSKSYTELEEYLVQIKNMDYREYFNNKEVNLEGIDLIIKSPGIKMDNPIIKKALEKDVEVITDLEFAYRLKEENNFICITGTNGKTTTTSLVANILKEEYEKVHVAGNIGVGLVWESFNSKDEPIVIEASSFQLDGCKYFRPKIAAILNLSPDHINWHGSYDKYINAKKKICINQRIDDYLILNYEDELLRKWSENIKSHIIWFSSERKLDKGAYIDNNKLILKNDKEKIEYISIGDLQIIGKHNIENALASIAIAYAMNVTKENIVEGLRTFSGVEHRIEYVCEKEGVRFFNDSKGTNVDASIKAIEAVGENIILIAGGKDKGIEFDDFIKSFKGRVKKLILLGETKYLIEETARNHGFNSIKIVEDMKEAVEESKKVSKSGDVILLSPACASWDMYNNFEDRGEDFKSYI